MGIIDSIKGLITGGAKPQGQTTAENAREPDENEKKEVGEWFTRIKRAEQRPEHQAFVKTAAEFRKAVKGMRNGERVRVNLIFSTMNVILPRIYAKQPTIKCRAAERVSPREYPWIQNFGKTLELLINQQFRRAELKKRGKGWVRAAMTVALGWLKVTYQRDYETDPETTNRIADTQDNLARVERLVAEIEAADAEGADELELKKAELKDQLESLQAQLEVAVSQGMVIDQVDGADLIVDDGIGCLDDYKNAGFMVQKVWTTDDEFSTKHKQSVPVTATRYNRAIENPDAPPVYTESKGPAGEEKGSTGRWLCLYEIWDRRAQVIRTCLEGAPQWVCEPYRLDKNGRRFYPFFLLAFNWVDGEAWPMADVEQWLPLQDDAQDRDKKRSDFIKAYKPGLVGSKGAINKADVDHFVTADGLEVTLLDIEGPINNVLQNRPNPAFDPAIYDTTDVHARMDIVSGASDAARGGVIRPKTATEASYIEQGLTSRSDDRLDMIEDVLAEMGQYTGEILLQELTKEQVLTMVGGVPIEQPPAPPVDPALAAMPGAAPAAEPQAEVEIEAVWPQLDREQIYNLVQIEVEAGSTGRPNKLAEREAWSTAMPMIQEAMFKIMELRQQGQQQAAKSLIALVDHSLRVLDERLTIEQFIPDAGAEELPPPDPATMEFMQAQLDDLRATTGEKRARAVSHLVKASEPPRPSKPPGNGARAQ